MGKRVGLALGGGSARGLAHLGVIDALEGQGVQIDVVAGTSVGSVVGALYAAGEYEKLKDFLLTVDFWKMLSFFEINLPTQGLFDGRKVSQFFRDQFNVPDIEFLGKPFAAVCYDYLSCERVVMDRGDTITAIRASSSVPGLLTPVKYKGRLLVDGGMIDPVPVTAARDLGADVVIAVDLNHFTVSKKAYRNKKEDAPSEDPNVHPLLALLERTRNLKKRRDLSPGILNMMMDSIYIMEKSLTDINLKNSRPEIVIRPDLGSIKFMEFHRAEEGIALGRSATEDLMDDILKAVGR